MCLYRGTANNYVERMSIQSTNFDRRIATIKKRIAAGYNTKRNKIKMRELARCSNTLQEELIPRLEDVCEFTRINVELERIALKKRICNVLNPLHLICKS